MDKAKRITFGRNRGSVAQVAALLRRRKSLGSGVAMVIPSTLPETASRRNASRMTELRWNASRVTVSRRNAGRVMASRRNAGRVTASRRNAGRVTASRTALTAAELVRALHLAPHPEGGFFREIYRSGTAPMSTRGATSDGDAATSGHVVFVDQNKRNTRAARGGNDGRRDALTSIYYLQTRSQPTLPLACNLSTHVHYWQGGGVFEYITVDPQTGAVSKTTLGPDPTRGHSLQISVEGGTWKCGRLLEGEYCLIGEAVAPGFDFCDFRWVTSGDVARVVCDATHRATLSAYIHEDATHEDAAKDADFHCYYDDVVCTKNAISR